MSKENSEERRALKRKGKGHQEGQIYKLRGYLFARRWDLHHSELSWCAREQHTVERGDDSFTVFAAVARSLQGGQGGHQRAAQSGGARGGPSRSASRTWRTPLSDTNPDCFTVNPTDFPGMPAEPHGCCRSWYVRGECNLEAGKQHCRFTHHEVNKGLGPKLQPGSG